jgi:hypothetical protein
MAHQTIKDKDRHEVWDIYESFTDVVHHMNQTRDGEGSLRRYPGKNSSLAIDRNPDWVTFRTFDGYLDAVTTRQDIAYTAIAERALQCAQEAMRHVTWGTPVYKRQQAYRSTGSTLRMRRVWSGHAQNAWVCHPRQERLDQGGIVTLILPASVRANTSADTIIANQLAGYVLSAVLAYHGKRADTWVLTASHCVFNGTWDHIGLVHSQTPAVAPSIHAWVPYLFPDYFRRFSFRAKEHAGYALKMELHKSYGYSFVETDRVLGLLDTEHAKKFMSTTNLIVLPATNAGLITCTDDIAPWVEQTLAALNNTVSH